MNGTMNLNPIREELARFLTCILVIMAAHGAHRLLTSNCNRTVKDEPPRGRIVGDPETE